MHRQLKLFIDFRELKIIGWGTDKDIERFLSSKDMSFSLLSSDVANSGWDYIVEDERFFLIIDLNWEFKKIEPLMFLFDDELKGIIGLVTYLKSYIRDCKLKQLGIRH